MARWRLLLIMFFIFTLPPVFLADTSEGGWGTTTVDSTTSADTGRFTSIAVGTSGAVYISYLDNTNNDLMYATNVSGSWGTETVDNSVTIDFQNSIAVGTSGAVYISYFDDTNDDLMYATNVSGSWGTETVDSTGDTGYFTSIAVGTSGAAYISYYDFTNKDLMYATNVSGTWGTTTVDSTGWTGLYTSIAVGTSGAVYISYSDNNTYDLMYATNVSGSSWGTFTVDSTGNTGRYSSIAVGTSGAAYISYYDFTNDDLMYATNVSGSWGTTTVDSTGITGQYTSIAVGSSGAAYISYYDASNDDLMYATNVSGSWGTTTVDSTGITGLYTSIAVGTSGAAYISYYDSSNTNLMYAAYPTHTAVTGAESGVSTSGATLAGTANATGLETTAFFQYGASSGSYTGTSSTQSVSGASDTAVSIALSGLSAGTTYYYRLANQHYTNLVYGDESSFTTSSSGGGGWEPPAVTLSVSSTTPSSGATDVSVDTTISAKFSMLINGSTVSTESIYVSEADGNKIEGAASTDSYNAVFTPSGNLSYGATYTAVATTKIQAANWAGTQMDSNYSWSFTTESAPIVPMPTPAPTVTSSPTPAVTSSPTPIPVVVATQTSTPAPTPTLLAEATPTPAITEETPTPSMTPTPTSTPAITEETPIPSMTPTLTPIPTSSPSLTPTPSPTPTPVYEGSVTLNKESAYLSGDTVIVTVADSDRNTGAETEEILTTAIKITGDNYYIGNDLLLDLNEDGADSGTFLATIKTGTTTIGGAGSAVRSNIGTVYAIQDGTVTVTYSPDAFVSVAKKLSFSSFDAQLSFDRPVYRIGEYAGITLTDAESNADHATSETLTDEVYIDTSSFNTTGVRMLETGTDTGIFRGSIQISNDSTLEYERIHAAEGDTLTASCYDETTTTGFPQLVTDTCSVAALTVPTATPPVIPSPTPTQKPSPSPSPTPSASPSPTPCAGGIDAEEITVSPDSLELEKREEGEVTVTVTGADGCVVEGVRVTRKIATSDKRKIKVKPSSRKTDAEGKAIFTIKAKKVKCSKNEDCTATVKFKATGVKEKAEVTVSLVK